MKDYFNYQGKVCVVTGSSNGMGLATTKMLVDLGAKVYAVSRSTTKVEGIEASILCDLSCKEDIDKAFAQLPDHIDCFFGVAGLSGSKTPYLTTFNCDFTANKYITLEYLTKRMSAGGSIVYVLRHVSIGRSIGRSRTKLSTQPDGKKRKRHWASFRRLPRVTSHICLPNAACPSLLPSRLSHSERKVFG